MVLHKILRCEFILRQFFFFLLLILLFFPLSLHSKSSTLYHFSSGSFLLYNETVIGYFPNGSHYILYEFYFQNITLVYENGTMEVETIVYDKNSTSYLSPAYSLDYVSNPTVFMFVNPSDLGKPEVRDGLVYNGTVNGLYEYYQLEALKIMKYIIFTAVFLIVIILLFRK